MSGLVEWLNQPVPSWWLIFPLIGAFVGMAVGGRR